MKTEAQIFDELNKLIDTNKIEHLEIDPFTLRLGSGDYEFTAKNKNGIDVSFKFTEQGAGCFNWFVNGYNVEESLKEKVSYAEFTSRVRAINEGGLKKSDIRIRQQYLLDRMSLVLRLAFEIGDTLWLHLRRGRVVGVTRQWSNIIGHKDIVELLQDEGMLSKYSYSYIDDKTFTVDLKIDGDERFVLRVSNGHSGHETLNYKVITKFKKLDFLTNLSGKARHLSKLPVVFANIENVMNEARTKNIAVKLGGMTAKETISDIFRFFTTRSSMAYFDFVRGDYRKRLMGVTEVQEEKIDDLISKTRDSFNGITASGYDAITKMSAISQNGKGAKMVGEILINAYLLDMWSKM